MLIAATLGDETRVRELLRDNASLANAADPCWRRPLSGAASKGHTNIVRLLLEHGADPNAKEAICQGGLSLHEAAAKGFVEIAQLLLDTGAVPEHWVDSSGDSVYAAQRHPKVLHLLKFVCRNDGPAGLRRVPSNRRYRRGSQAAAFQGK